MRIINNLMLKSLIPISLVFVAAARAENICHEKPNGACLECCSKTNKADFQAKTAVICSKRPSIAKENLDSFYEKEAAVLAASEKKSSVKDSETENIYAEYLSRACLEDGNIKSPDLAYAECAKGCPPPPKRKRKK